MHYKYISIENYRSIKKLLINDLRKVNLIVGKNNSGKTSILESFFLLSGVSNPQLVINIHKFRDLILTDDEDFSYIFNNLDFSNIINISANFNSVDRVLKISPIFSDISDNIKNENKSNNELLKDKLPSSTSFEKKVNGILLESQYNNKPKQISKYSISEKKAVVNIKKEYVIPGSFLTPQSILVNILSRIDKLMISKDLPDLINELKKVDSKIEDIRLGINNMIYIDIGINKLIPINIIGDGILHLISILITIKNLRNGILLIDEIDNGLHYTSLKILWNAIFDACERYNVQLIASTHSYECIEIFTNAYQYLETNEDNIRLFRIEKNNEEHKVILYTSSDIIRGIQKDFEVR
ncbi:MAG TPA: hypothetical protein DC057_19350 [Spirochaetia bacterium]|nr:MAG: hypothetical protein A2014_11630 [Spirochaetes bacterium GWF1_49_6]HBD96335.1 hypothetical protein [Spirochaetia bacterium]